MSRATVTGIVSTLEKRRLVTRRPHPVDGRSQLVGITAKGRRRTREFLEALHQVDRQIMNSVSENEQAMFLSSLARIQANTPTVDVPLPLAQSGEWRRGS